ncbi:hypothetical protein H8356DRAFT_611444 [Neocallimastix lanati (nom. inval.)]|jgi:hypothetical protein|uniref:Uncharacterized protein n=1 Tax=Neocallimastix californiae TaxID=1754190 RepID=A0A1Y2DJI0_9FUNG|nr:hypothetical protein H8356DRAFT_611444 [Neocallimastix sp. JGI-2020a]ORY59390.1 hypothetical protein LY90DRAFT_506058 [Neocallimastix californiae]|eukprot:ORY59390.1 hypothetical protein LY90DRAFT_506058 [Neocallimastix californiae]
MLFLLWIFSISSSPFHSKNGDTFNEKSKLTTCNAEMRYCDLKEANNKATLKGVITFSVVLGSQFRTLMATYLGELFCCQWTIMIDVCIFTCDVVIQDLFVRSWIMIVISRHITDLSIDCNGILCLTYIF